MSLIEQAAKRLSQLRQAGVEFPDDLASPNPRVPAGSALAPAEPIEVAIPRGGLGKSLPDGTPLPPVARDSDSQNQTSSKRVDIDLFALEAKHIITPDQTRSQVSEEYRLIKRPLIANAMGKGAAPVAHGNLIMVTSALPKEGKSHTAVNLAISIAAELDKTVLLVDADVARPSVLNILGLPPAQGLLDCLPGSGTQLNLSDVLLRTNIEKLTLLPSGMPRKGATELLASDAMAALVNEMAERYPDRIIIFDSPPLLLTTESRVLATHMGQIVMVVQAEKTSQAQVRQALATIESCPVKMTVLNQVRTRGTDGSYGYGYGYGNG